MIIYQTPFTKPETKHKRITTPQFLEETIFRTQLECKVIKFSREVWPDIQLANAISDIRGFRLDMSQMELKTWYSAGRILINLVSKTNKKVFLALVGDASDATRNCGVQGMNATYPEMLELLDGVLSQWPQSKANYLPDKTIGVL